MNKYENFDQTTSVISKYSIRKAQRKNGKPMAARKNSPWWEPTFSASLQEVASKPQSCFGCTHKTHNSYEEE